MFRKKVVEKITDTFLCLKIFFLNRAFYEIIWKLITSPEHFDVWSKSMANTYQRNKQDFSYRNGCAKENSKKIKVRKNIK
jgi:hypothetical protein